MFYLASEIKQLVKIKTITQPEEILVFLDAALSSEEYPGYSVRFVRLPGERAELRVQAGTSKKIFPIKPILHPSRRLLREECGEADTLLVTAHLSEPLAADLRQAGIPHADLNGRLFVCESGLLLDRRPAKTEFRPPKTGADPFAAKASRLVRTLLAARDQRFTQKELVARTELSPAGVSNALADLVVDGFVRQEGKGSRSGPAFYAVEDFDALLDAWKKKDIWAKRTTIHEYSVLSGQIQSLAEMVQARLGGIEPVTKQPNLVFTQWFAAWQRRPYTIPPVVSAYVRPERLTDDLPWRRVNSGGNLWLVVPGDDGVFFETREENGFQIATDVQIYLDLLQVGQRGPDQAEELRKWDGFAR